VTCLGLQKQLAQHPTEEQPATNQPAKTAATTWLKLPNNTAELPPGIAALSNSWCVDLGFYQELPNLVSVLRTGYTRPHQIWLITGLQLCPDSATV